MTCCPECETELDLELEDLEIGDLVSCEECGVQMEIVHVEPFEAMVIQDDEEDSDEEGGPFGDDDPFGDEREDD